MNNKLLVTVSVPTMELEYDIYIPINKKVKVVKQLIINSIVDLTFNLYKPNNELALYWKESGKRVEEQLYVKEANIMNGDKLVLI